MEFHGILITLSNGEQLDKWCCIVWKMVWKISPSNIDSWEALNSWQVLSLTAIISASLTVYNSLVTHISYILSVDIKLLSDSAFENPSVPVAPSLTACVAVPSRLAGTSLMSCLVSDHLFQQLLHQSQEEYSEQIVLMPFSGDITYIDSWSDSIRQSLLHPEQCLAPLQSTISPGNCCDPWDLEEMQPGQEISVSPSSNVYVCPTVAFQHAGYWVLLLAPGQKETSSPETSPPFSHM